MQPADSKWVPPPASMSPEEVIEWNKKIADEHGANHHHMVRTLMCGPCKGSGTTRDPTIMAKRVGLNLLYYCGYCTSPIVLLDASRKPIRVTDKTRHAKPIPAEEVKDDTEI